MVGAPLPSSGNHPQHYGGFTGNSGPNPASIYATPNATMSTLLPYNGMTPNHYQNPTNYPKTNTTSSPSSHFPAYPPVQNPSPPPHTAYPPPPYPPQPPHSLAYHPQTAYPPPPQSTYPPSLQSSAYPPAGYPPQPPLGAPSGYPSVTHGANHGWQQTPSSMPTYPPSGAYPPHAY